MSLLLCLFPFLGIFFSFSKDLLFKTKLLRNESFTCTWSQGKTPTLTPPPIFFAGSHSQKLHLGASRSSPSVLLTHRELPSSTLLPSHGVTEPAFLVGCGIVSLKPLHGILEDCLTLWTLTRECDGTLPTTGLRFLKNYSGPDWKQVLPRRIPGCSLRISFLESPEVLRHGFSIPRRWGNASRWGRGAGRNLDKALIGRKDQIRYLVFGKILWGLWGYLGNGLEAEFSDWPGHTFILCCN